MPAFSRLPPSAKGYRTQNRLQNGVGAMLEIPAWAFQKASAK